MEGISVKTKDIVCAVICMDQRLLIAKRSSGVHENIWEFPGGKVEPEETREQAVARNQGGAGAVCGYRQISYNDPG